MCVFWAANTTTVQYRQDLEANDAEKDGRKQKSDTCRGKKMRAIQ